MPQMISAAYVEKIIIREMGVNHLANVELQKMAVDHKSVKATIKSGPAKVEFTLQEEKPTFKVTGENIAGELYLQFLENMNSMVDEIFNQEGGGLYDYDRRTGDAEVKEKFIVDEVVEELDQYVEVDAETIEVSESEQSEIDTTGFEMSEDEIVAEVIDVVGEGNVVVQETLEVQVENEQIEEVNGIETAQWSTNPAWQ